MFGIQLWLVLAAVLSVGAVLFVSLAMRSRSWTYRLLMAVGLLALIWGVLPALGGGGISPYLVVGAIIAFGFLILTDATAGDGSRW